MTKVMVFTFTGNERAVKRAMNYLDHMPVQAFKYESKLVHNDEVARTASVIVKFTDFADGWVDKAIDGVKARTAYNMTVLRLTTKGWVQA